MNVSAVASSALAQVIEEFEKNTGNISGSTSPSPTTAVQLTSPSTDSVPASERSGSVSFESTVTQDLVNLLKSLASDNASTSKANLTKLASDVKAAEQENVDLTEPSSSVGELNRLVSTLRTALESGSTSSALSRLSSYLVQSDLSTGNLVSVSA